jgi:hypothetical protein
MACDSGVLEWTWAWYLENATFGDLGNVSFWTRFRATMLRPAGAVRPVLCDALGTLGLIFAIMPVSESGVERIFSHLRDLLLPHRDGMDAELVQARLLLKLNHYPDEVTCEERLRHLDSDDRGKSQTYEGNRDIGCPVSNETSHKATHVKSNSPHHEIYYDT